MSIELYNDGINEIMMAVLSTEDLYTRGKLDVFLTASEANKGVLEYWLSRRYEKQTDTIIKRPASSKYNIMIGNAIHKYIEDKLKTNKEYVLEKRLYLDMGKLIGLDEPAIVSGQFDLIKITDRILWDHKTMKVSKFLVRDWEAYTLQANIYRLLLRMGMNEEEVPVKFNIEGLRLNVVLKDWSLGQIGTKPDYPATPFPVVVLPVWEIEETIAKLKDAIEERLKYKNTITENIPECTPEQRWQKPTVYVVLKKNKDGSKKISPKAMPNTANITDRKDAESYMISHKDSDLLYVEKRESKALYCSSYCDYSSICPFWKKNKEKYQWKKQ